MKMEVTGIVGQRNVENYKKDTFQRKSMQAKGMDGNGLIFSFQNRTYF